MENARDMYEYLEEMVLCYYYEKLIFECGIDNNTTKDTLLEKCDVFFELLTTFINPEKLNNICRKLMDPIT